MSHPHDPPPRWLWPLTLLLLVVILLLAIFAPIDRATAHAHTETCGH